MNPDSFEDLVQSAAIAELATGPLEILELVARLRRSGVLAHLESLDDEQLTLELDEILLGSDGIWTTDDGTVASTAALLNGVNFSHRVTSSELERGVLDAIPDLSVLDFDIAGSLALESGVNSASLSKMTQNSTNTASLLDHQAGWARFAHPGRLSCLDLEQSCQFTPAQN